MAVTVAGLDVGFSNDLTALVVIRKETVDGKQLITLIHLYSWDSMDWNSWKDDMVSKYKQFGFPRVYVDQTSNQSVVSMLNELGISTDGVTFTNSSKQDMLQQLRKVLITGELVFPVLVKIQSRAQQEYFEELIRQIEEQEIIQDSANLRFAHPSGRHDDLLWALCLAIHGIPREREFCGFNIGP